MADGLMRESYHHLIAWISVHGVEPLLSRLHMQSIAGNPRDIAEALLITCLQIAIIGFIFRPLETLAPAEIWPDRALTRIDRHYTLLMLLGLNPLFAFLVMTPLAHVVGGADMGTTTQTVGGLLHYVPGMNHHPYLAFAFYYLVYDLAYYWMHRIQHLIPWWWALHSMHHSQRQMSCWTNDRGSYLDGMLQSFVLAAVGMALGVDASQFALFVLISELMQNLSHTNTRLGFGRRIEKLFVDPRFHRLHHMRMDPNRLHLHHCNYGQVLSIWDSLFKTALFGEPLRPTGVGDPMVDVDNERGLVAMQWGTLRRFWGAFRHAAGWRFGDVSFGSDYVPISVKDADPSSFIHRPIA